MSNLTENARRILVETAQPNETGRWDCRIVGQSFGMSQQEADDAANLLVEQHYAWKYEHFEETQGNPSWITLSRLGQQAGPALLAEENIRNDYKLLKALYARSDKSTGVVDAVEVGRKFGLHGYTACHAANRLADEGLVEIMANDPARELVRVRLTDAGVKKAIALGEIGAGFWTQGKLTVVICFTIMSSIIGLFGGIKEAYKFVRHPVQYWQLEDSPTTQSNGN